MGEGPGADAARLGSLPPTPLRPGVPPEADADGADRTAPTAPANGSPPPVRTGPPPLPTSQGRRWRGRRRCRRSDRLRRRRPSSARLPPAIAESLAKLAAGSRGQQ